MPSHPLVLLLPMSSWLPCAQMGDKARAEREAVRGTFEGAISEAFEGPLALYVAEEGKELSAYLEVGAGPEGAGRGVGPERQGPWMGRWGRVR